MFYAMVEYFCKEKMNQSVWEFLEISQPVWSRYKKNKNLPPKHFKKICQVLEIENTEDELYIARKLLTKWYSHDWSEW